MTGVDDLETSEAEGRVDMASARGRSRGRRILGAYLAAAAVAPAVTAALAAVGLDANATSMANPLSGLIATMGLALILGFVGSMITLAGPMSLAAWYERRDGAKRWRYVVAGASAGALHVALASPDLPVAGDRGLSALLGTWFIRMLLSSNHNLAACSPVVAGAAAGWVYGAMTIDRPRTPSSTPPAGAPPH